MNEQLFVNPLPRFAFYFPYVGGSIIQALYIPSIGGSIDSAGWNIPSFRPPATTVPTASILVGKKQNAFKQNMFAHMFDSLFHILKHF